ncbi:MAG: signal peptidase I [Chloroflexota bacterium]|nr:signal peptidase I [Chloroflexota bacterium]
MRRWISVRRALALALVGLGVLVLVAAVAVRIAGFEFQTVLSGSMAPTVHAGDVAVTQPVSVAALTVGDVIAFYPPNDPNPRLHRITTLGTVDGIVTVTTRGDANGVDDPWHASLRGSIAYRMVAVVPFVGFLAQYRGLLFIGAGLFLAAAFGRSAYKEVRHRRLSPI